MMNMMQRRWDDEHRSRFDRERMHPVFADMDDDVILHILICSLPHELRGNPRVIDWSADEEALEAGPEDVLHYVLEGISMHPELELWELSPDQAGDLCFAYLNDVAPEEVIELLEEEIRNAEEPEEE